MILPLSSQERNLKRKNTSAILIFHRPKPSNNSRRRRKSRVENEEKGEEQGSIFRGGRAECEEEVKFSCFASPTQKKILPLL